MFRLACGAWCWHRHGKDRRCFKGIEFALLDRGDCPGRAGSTGRAAPTAAGRCCCCCLSPRALRAQRGIAHRSALRPTGSLRASSGRQLSRREGVTARRPPGPAACHVLSRRASLYHGVEGEPAAPEPALASARSQLLWTHRCLETREPRRPHESRRALHARRHSRGERLRSLARRARQDDDERRAAATWLASSCQGHAGATR